jgi:hypothetical protein
MRLKTQDEVAVMPCEAKSPADVLKIDRVANVGHALIRTTLYEELNASRRARMHRRVGEALEEHAEPLADLRHEAGHGATLRPLCQEGEGGSRSSPPRKPPSSSPPGPQEGRGRQANA